MRAHKKLSDDEVDRELIEDAANPEAWGPPITVTPIRSQRRSAYREQIPTRAKSGVSEKPRNR